MNTSFNNRSPLNMHADSLSYPLLLSIFNKGDAHCEVSICSSLASSICSLLFIPLFRPTQAQFPNNTDTGSPPPPPKSDMDLSPESISRILFRVQSHFSIFLQGMVRFIFPSTRKKKKKSLRCWKGKGSPHFLQK